MERDLRFAGPVILVLWCGSAVAAAAMVFAALEALQPGGAASEVLDGLARHDVAFGALIALAFIGTASHLAPTDPGGPSEPGIPLSRWPRPRVAATALGGGLAVALGSAAAAGGAAAGPARLAFAALLGALLLLFTTSAAAFAMRRLPAACAWFSLRLVPAGLALGAAAAVLFDRLVEFLQRGSMMAVAAIVHRLYADATSDLALNEVGTAAFRVQVFPACSGIEGMTLGALLVVPYLYLMRRRLRFPAALVLVPVLLGALAAVNIGRIVLLIAIGQHASRQALDAFHSSIGWFTFALAIAVVIPATEALFRLRIRPSESEAEAPQANEAAPYLLPIAASLLFVFALSALALEASPLAYGRYATAAAVIFWYRDRLGELRLPSGVAPVLAGAAVAVLYLLFLPQDAAPSALASAAFGGLRPFWAVLHVLGYVLVTPLIEELAFRGYLLRRLVSESFTGVPYAEAGWGALLASSLAFGAMHAHFLPSAIAGLAFGAVARTAGGLRGAFVAHGVANGLLAAYALLTHRLWLMA